MYYTLTMVRYIWCWDVGDRLNIDSIGNIRKKKWIAAAAATTLKQYR